MKNFLLALPLLLTAIGARAADKPAPAMDDAMKKAMELAAPGPEHARLGAFVGRWKTASKMWMKPGDKPMDSMGESTFSWMLGGRYLKQDFAGDMGGTKFEGMGYLGYDRMKKQYASAWLDNMSTHLMTTTGQFDEKTGVIKDEGTFSCPMTGELARWYRGEMALPKNDTFTYAMYGKDEKGNEYKTMEIVYTKLK